MHSVKSDSVKAASRTLDMFEVFARHRGPLSLSELANHMGCPVSSTHALVKTMRARGYVYVLDDRKMIYPTKRIFTIANLIASNDPVVELILPILTGLQEQSKETLILGKLHGTSILYLEVLESSNLVRFSSRPGDRKTLSSAIGKSVLSAMSKQEIAALYEKHDPKSDGPIANINKTELLADINAGRQNQMFFTRGENVADVMAISIPVNLGGETLAIAIAGPLTRMTEKEQACTRLLRQAQEAITVMKNASTLA